MTTEAGPENFLHIKGPQAFFSGFKDFQRLFFIFISFICVSLVTAVSNLLLLAFFNLHSLFLQYAFENNSLYSL